MNKVILLGRLVADPEIRYTQLNIPFCQIRLAVNKQGKPKEGQANAEFLNIVAWRGTAEFLGKYFRKGMQVLVEGHLKTNTWDDNGTKRYKEYTQADHIYFTNSKKTDNPQVNLQNFSNAVSANSDDQSYYSLNEDDEDLPL